MKNFLKNILGIAIIGLMFPISASALIPCQVVQGCTGVNTITGIPYGTGTSALGIVTVGTGLSFSAGTLSSTSTSPLTTKGDIYGHSTVDARIPVGTDGQLLSADSTQALGVKWIAAPATGLTVGSTAVASGTSGRVLYDNAGTLGEMTNTGSGTVSVLQTSPTLITPTLGVASATSLYAGTAGAAGISNYTILSSETGSSTMRGIGATQISSDNNSSRFNLFKARGTPGSESIITTGDILGNLAGWGFDGANYLNMASIQFVSSGTIAATRIPTEIRFLTGTNATPSVATEAVRITNAQQLNNSLSTMGFGSVSSPTATLTVSASANVSQDYTTSGTPQFARLGLGAAADSTALLFGSASIGATSTDGFVLTNPTAATVGAQKWSPRLHFTGQGWKTTATAGSQTVDWIQELVPAQGTTSPSASLNYSYQINGGGYNSAVKMYSNGGVDIGPAFLSGGSAGPSANNGGLALGWYAAIGGTYLTWNGVTAGHLAYIYYDDSNLNFYLNNAGGFKWFTNNAVPVKMNLSSGGNLTIGNKLTVGSLTEDSATLAEKYADSNTAIGSIANGFRLFNTDTTVNNISALILDSENAGKRVQVYGQSGGIGFGLNFVQSMFLNSSGIISTYAGVATASNGIAVVRGTADLTAQTAAKTATTLCASTLPTGLYRISVYLQVTTAASTSSVLGGTNGVTITYNDGDGNVAQSDTVALATTAGAIGISSATNTTATNLTGTLPIYMKTGTAVQYAIDYTSVGVTPMAYAAHLKCEAL